MSDSYDQSRRRRSSKTQQISSLLLSDFVVMCSFILSHPLYFSYFIFFSPYLLKLLTFLSPLFITTTLLLLALLTLSPSLLHPQSTTTTTTTDSKVCFLLSTCHNVLEKLQTEAEDSDDEVEDIRQFVELEAYRIVFDTSTFEVKENPGEDLGVFEASRCISEQDPVEITQSDISEPIRDGDCLEESIKEISTECENITHNVEDKEVIKSITYSNKVEQQKEQPPPPPPPSFTRSGSKAKGNRVSQLVSKINANNNGGEYISKGSENSCKLTTDNGGKYTSKAGENSETLGESGNLGNFGSMRKDKEWKRTLACKLFEERHNVDGGEGMDSLWETYETDPNKVQPKKNSNTKKGKKNGIDYNIYENDEEEVDDAQLCCLQALKFSSGKMTLGMGKPNLMRFSKALKGLGWLHHVSSSSSKHGKKGSN